jgi:hypothetical protein
MKRKLLGLMVGLLVGSGIAAASLVQAGGGDKGNQTIQQEEREDPEESETSEVEDADEAGDDDGPGDVED